MTFAGDVIHGRVHVRRVGRLVELIAARIRGNARVVDVGSGDGLLASRLLAARPDLSIRAFDVLARPVTHVPVELFDGVQIPVGDGGCDVALLLDVLHHTDDPRQLLLECKRIAAHAVIVKDHLREGFGAAMTLRFMDWVGNARHGVRLPNNYLSRAEWQALLAGTGLRATQWNERLGLYPGLPGLVFGRQLHMLATLADEQARPTGRGTIVFPASTWLTSCGYTSSGLSGLALRSAVVYRHKCVPLMEALWQRSTSSSGSSRKNGSRRPLGRMR